MSPGASFEEVVGEHYTAYGEQDLQALYRDCAGEDFDDGIFVEE